MFIKAMGAPALKLTRKKRYAQHLTKKFIIKKGVV